MFVGIDYSLSSPAICISPDENCSFILCKFYFLTTKKKFEGTWNNIYGDLHPEWTTPSERYHNISQWVVDTLSKYDSRYGLQAVQRVTLEDYAMGAKGRVFHIGENTGVLKYRLWKNHINTHVISPSEVKKFATGKGNANKEAMYDAFVSDYKSYNLKDIMGQDAKLDSPVTDIIDAYYICKAGIERI
jgi:Holliday junction resolvasome RuvABC endonuclease subunit